MKYLFRLVAKAHPEHALRLLALEEGDTPDEDLIRLIDVAAGVAYPPTNKERFVRRSPVWFPLDGFDEPLDLEEYLQTRPDIQDLETPAQYSAWVKANPRFLEPPVDPSNTVGAYLREMAALGLHTSEQRRAYNQKRRDARREEMQRRMAGETPVDTAQE